MGRGSGWRPATPTCAGASMAWRSWFRRRCGVIPMAGICLYSVAAGGGLIKVLWHDGQGLCLFSKRLERGRFLWPSPADGVVTITPAQLGYLLEGIDWRMPQYTWRPQAAG